jgi:hypothetical protein
MVNQAKCEKCESHYSGPCPEAKIFQEIFRMKADTGVIVGEDDWGRHWDQ